jgi:site-specific DNA recombinase
MTDYYPPPRDLVPGSTVWAYLRDSGGPTQQDSVTQQETEVRAFCDRHSLILIEIFQDVAKSGGSVISRDDFERMIDTSKEKNFRPHGLLIWNFARFSRDSNDSTFYKALLRKRGIIIHSLTDPIPEDDFASRIVETIIDFSNEEKRRQNSRDVKRGLRSLVSKGFAPGTPPKGYMRVPVELGVNRDGKPRMVSKWVRDPALWDSVVLAWQMRANGKSYREIQKATGEKIYKSINCWNTFFKSKTYLGYYGDVPDNHEPAITWEVWEAVQKLLQEHPLYKNNPRHPRRVGTPSLLTGITYCLDCGAMMTHSPGHKKKPWRFYICGKKDRQGVKACTSRRVSEKNSERAIMDAIRDKILSADFLAEVLESARARYSDTSDLERRITLAKRKMEDLRLAIQRTLNAIESTGSQSALDRLKEREKERAQVQTEITTLESQLASAKVEITPEAMKIILDTWRQQLTEARATNDIKLIRAWMMRFVSRIELGYNRGKIYFTYPMIDFSLPDDNSRNVNTLHGGTKRVANQRLFFLCIEERIFLYILANNR